MKIAPILFVICVCLLVVAQLGSWVVNIVKFTRCDFEAPYKAEALHGLGIVVPGASLLTAWVDDK